MKKTVAYFLITAILLGLLGCSQAASGQVLQSEKPRNTTPAVSQADMKALAEANNAFAFKLYQELRQTDGNIFYSPYSISEALAMTWAGARGTTESDMAAALSFTLGQQRLHPVFNSLDLELKKRGETAKSKDGEGFRLNIVNAIWAQKDYKFLSQYLDTLAENYGAGVRILDFMREPEPSRQIINQWVAEQTAEKIKDLIPQGSINDLTRLVLTNAIYFNAAWAKPFKPESTSAGDFTLLSGSKVTVPMMKQTESFRYAEADDYQAVELPYDGMELAMVIIVPRLRPFESFGIRQSFDRFENAMDSKAVEDIVGKLARNQVILSMPKFQYDSSFGLKKALSDLGMGVAFTPDADFSGMNGNRDLLIQDVVHKAYVSVDEAGTEAAAATGVIVGVTSAPPTPVELTIDRPFIFLIRDIPTGSTLFVGRVLNPAGK